MSEIPSEYRDEANDIGRDVGEYEFPHEFNIPEFKHRNSNFKFEIKQTSGNRELTMTPIKVFQPTRPSKFKIKS